jgi:hypothetical protein
MPTAAVTCGDDLLAVIGEIGDDRRAADFGTGAGRRRHADRLGDARDVDARIPVFAVLEVP